MVRINSATKKAGNVVEKKFSYKTPFQLAAERRTAMRGANLERIKNAELKAPKSAAKIVAEIKEARRIAAGERLKKMTPEQKEKLEAQWKEKLERNSEPRAPKTLEEAFGNAKNRVMNELRKGKGAAENLQEKMQELLKKEAELASVNNEIEKLTAQSKYGLSEKQQAKLDHLKSIQADEWEKNQNDMEARNENDMLNISYHDHVSRIENRFNQEVSEIESLYHIGEIDSSTYQQKMHSALRTRDELILSAVKRMEKEEIEKQKEKRM